MTGDLACLLGIVVSLDRPTILDAGNPATIDGHAFSQGLGERLREVPAKKVNGEVPGVSAALSRLLGQLIRQLRAQLPASSGDRRSGTHAHHRSNGSPAKSERRRVGVSDLHFSQSSHAAASLALRFP